MKVGTKMDEASRPQTSRRKRLLILWFQILYCTVPSAVVLRIAWVQTTPSPNANPQPTPAKQPKQYPSWVERRPLTDYELDRINERNAEITGHPFPY
jgi:hypothetical protein